MTGKTRNIASTERDISSIYRCCWNVTTYKWKVHNGKIEIISFVVNFHSLPALTVSFEVWVKVWNRHGYICDIPYFKLKCVRCDQ